MTFQSSTTHDNLSMRVPVTALSTPVIRLAAAQLAAQSGFSYDRVEDVRIAVGEAIRILTVDPDLHDGREAYLDAHFTVGACSLTVVIGLDDARGDVRVDDDSAQILDATTTTFQIDLANPRSTEVSVHFDMGTAIRAVPDKPSGRDD